MFLFKFHFPAFRSPFYIPQCLLYTKILSTAFLEFFKVLFLSVLHLLCFGKLPSILYLLILNLRNIIMIWIHNLTLCVSLSLFLKFIIFA